MAYNVETSEGRPEAEFTRARDPREYDRAAGDDGRAEVFCCHYSGLALRMDADEPGARILARDFLVAAAHWSVVTQAAVKRIASRTLPIEAAMRPDTCDFDLVG